MQDSGTKQRASAASINSTMTNLHSESNTLDGSSPLGGYNQHPYNGDMVRPGSGTSSIMQDDSMTGHGPSNGGTPGPSIGPFNGDLVRPGSGTSMTVQDDAMNTGNGHTPASVGAPGPMDNGGNRHPMTGPYNGDLVRPSSGNSLIGPDDNMNTGNAHGTSRGPVDNSNRHQMMNSRLKILIQSRQSNKVSSNQSPNNGTQPVYPSQVTQQADPSSYSGT